MARTTPAPPPPPIEPDESTTSTTGDGAASAPPPTDARPNRFFAWLRTLGVVRQPGWLGGVSAGVAARIGVDPLIVRGGLVVVALLGGPALILYAAAWLLLPDEQDKIHLEQVTRGRFESAIAGIAALVAISMLPVTQGFWYAGSAFWGDPALPDSIGRALWTFVIIGLLVWGVVWMIRRGNTGAAGAPPQAPTASAAPPVYTPAAPQAAAPQAPAPNASEAEFAAWREQQQTWKTEYDSYRHHNAEASLRAQELHRQRRLASAAENAERMRAWHRANPRLRASIVVMVLGAAVVAGGIASQLVAPARSLVIGLAVATLIVGIAIVAAGTFRRRNGFLSFVAIMLVPSTLLAAFVPSDRQLLWNVGTIDILSSGNYAQAGESLYIEDTRYRDGVNSVAADLASPVNIDVWHAAGETTIVIPEGARVRVIADIRSGQVSRLTYTTVTIDPDIPNDYNQDGIADEYDDMNGDGVVNKLDNRYFDQVRNDVDAASLSPDGTESWDDTFGTSAKGTPTITVRLWQGVGNVYVQDNYPEGL